MKNCVFDLTPSEKEWRINKLSYFRSKKELENNCHLFMYPRQMQPLWLRDDDTWCTAI